MVAPSSLVLLLDCGMPLACVAMGGCGLPGTEWASTLPLGTADPLQSVTLPVRDPYRAWADEGDANNVAATTAVTDQAAKRACCETCIIHLSNKLPLGELYLIRAATLGQSQKLGG